MFDDATTADVVDFRDHVLRKGRHKNIMCICVNHKMRAGNCTEHIWTNVRFVICFPSANRGEIMAFMRNNLEIHPKMRQTILDFVKSQGRHMIFHMQSPNIVAGAQAVLKL